MFKVSCISIHFQQVTQFEHVFAGIVQIRDIKERTIETVLVILTEWFPYTEKTDFRGQI